MPPSPSTPSATPAGGAWWRQACAVLALGALVFVAYFHRYPEFGVYGDDAGEFLVGGWANRTWSQELDWLEYCATSWPQGRPLHFLVGVGLLPYGALHVGGLPALHLLAFGLLFAGAVTLQRLVLRVASPLAAFMAGAFLAVAPAHTTQLSLVYSLGFSVSLLVALGAAHAALSGRWVLYTLAIAALVTMVESYAMLALAIGLGLTLMRPAPRVRPLLIQMACWALAVGLVLAVRSRMVDPWGKERVREATSDVSATLDRSLESAKNGTKLHFRLVGKRMLLPLRELDGRLALTMAATALGIGLALLALPRASRRTAPAPAGAPDAALVRARAAAGLAQLRALGAPLVLAIIGAGAMAATYAAYFRPPWYPTKWQSGFMSGVHMPAAAGMALLMAAIAWAAERTSAHVRPWVSRVVVAVPLVLLTGFGQLVQADYAGSWAFQREFWGAYDRLCRDAGAGTYVLVLDRKLPTFRHIERSSWTTEHLPALLYRPGTLGPGPSAGPEPQTWTPTDIPGEPAAASPTGPAAIRAPCVVFTAPDPAGALALVDGRVTWKDTYYFKLPKSESEQPLPGRVIVLEYTDAGWKRLEGEIPIDGGTLRLQPVVPDAPPRLRRPLARHFDIE